MKSTYLYLQTCLAVIITITAISCRESSNPDTDSASAILQKTDTIHSQIGEYVVETFEDSKGSLWFGTLQKGVAKYDGKKLEYLTIADGLPSNRVTTVTEDAEGNLWFGTGEGISKYDGNNFTTFSEKEGLGNNFVSNLSIDSKGTFWIGTWGGVYTFDGEKFSPFPLPYTKVETNINEDTKDWITEIYEDSKGNIWFSRDGYGACKYDGQTFTHYTKKEGLISNNITDIQEDAQGNIWFGSRVGEKDDPDPDKRQGSGGLTKYDGTNFQAFPKLKGLSGNDVYQIYCDSKENLWISTTSYGAYKYDRKEFTNYPLIDPVQQKPKAAMSFLEDQKGNIWIGCAGGLFRIDDGVAVNVMTNGPWD